MKSIAMRITAEGRYDGGDVDEARITIDLSSERRLSEAMALGRELLASAGWGDEANRISVTVDWPEGEA